MSIIRSFTMRRNKPALEISTPAIIGRAASQRAGRPVVRGQISSPKALVSTSNMEILAAQNIAGTSPIDLRNISSSSASSASSSGEDSDASTGSVHTGDITDASSIDESPINPEPGPNHLSCYFKPNVDTQTHARSPSQSPSQPSSPTFDTPRIPQRAPSHSKRAHEGIHRKRSIQRMLSPPPSRERSHEVMRSSTEIFNPLSPDSAYTPTPTSNPFDKELAQVDEVAEEFGQVVRSAEADADAVFMESRGLACYAASDYMYDIQTLVHAMFEDERTGQDLGGFF